VYSDAAHSNLIGSANLDVQSLLDASLHNRDQVVTITDLSPGDSDNLYVAFLGEFGGDGYLNAFQLDSFGDDTPGGFPGDGDGNGVVDGLDYLVWAGHYGDNPAADPPGSPGNGDYDNNGVVDGLDYLVWAENYGSGTATAVPEPASLATALLALVGLLAAPGRRRA
jgi:hypothetical protein